MVSVATKSQSGVLSRCDWVLKLSPGPIDKLLVYLSVLLGVERIELSTSGLRDPRATTCATLPFKH
jgi:hypothetical protein